MDIWICCGCMGASMGSQRYPWTSMDSNEYQWVSRFPRILLGCHGIPRSSTAIHGYLGSLTSDWVPRIPRYPWIFFGFLGIPRRSLISIDIHGYPWLSCLSGILEGHHGSLQGLAQAGKGTLASFCKPFQAFPSPCKPLQALASPCKPLQAMV